MLIVGVRFRVRLTIANSVYMVVDVFAFYESRHIATILKT
jgi:hypothetical protein